MNPFSRPDVAGLESYEADLQFDKEKFRTRLRNYLDEQQLTTLDEEFIADLFAMTAESAREHGVAAKMRTDQTKKDWATRGRLIDKLSEHFYASAKLLESCCKLKLPLTNDLAAVLKPRVHSVGQILERAEMVHRTNSKIAEMLKTDRWPGVLSMAINDFLKVYVPTLSAKERQVIIAGCLLAGEIYSEKENRDKDIVSRVAMQVSRSEADYGDEPRVIFSGSRRKSTSKKV